MSDLSTTTSRQRILILSQEPAAAIGPPATPPAQWQCVHVSSAYEAAAEILAEPPRALVVDLGLISQRHSRLLAMARQANVALLGIGSVQPGLSADDLSGVRLVARNELLEALAGLMDLPADGQAAGPAGAVKLAPAKAAPGQTPGVGGRPPACPQGGAGQWLGPDASPAAPDGYQPVKKLPNGDEQFLTPEELADLLENEP